MKLCPKCHASPCACEETEEAPVGTMDEFDALRETAREALELLREHQACKSVPHQLGGHYECSSCGGFAGEYREVRPPTHAPDCRLARVLRELEDATR